MDFNDIGRRLERVNASIDLLNSDDFKKTIQWTPGEFDIHFREENNISDENAIVSVISAIADLKDNLKNKMASMSLDPQLVEDEINDTLFLKLIADLDNQHKHGYPLTKFRRSKMDPEIKKISSGPEFQFNNGGLMLDLEKEEVSTVGDAKAELVVRAEIWDYGGNFICTLDQMVDGAMTVWENFVTRYNLK